MKHSYIDIRSRLGEPLWWDEQGVPRYDIFTPDALNDIYASTCALLLIMCHSCKRKFKVATSCDKYDELRTCYGDPPNVSCCVPGPTMSSMTLRVLQYWHIPDRTLELYVSNGTWWVRDESREGVHEDVAEFGLEQFLIDADGVPE